MPPGELLVPLSSIYAHFYPWHGQAFKWQKFR